MGRGSEHGVPGRDARCAPRRPGCARRPWADRRRPARSASRRARGRRCTASAESSTWRRWVTTRQKSSASPRTTSVSDLPHVQTTRPPGASSTTRTSPSGTASPCWAKVNGRVRMPRRATWRSRAVAGYGTPSPAATSTPCAHVSMSWAAANDRADIGPAIHGNRPCGSAARSPATTRTRSVRQRASTSLHAVGAGGRPVPASRSAKASGSVRATAASHDAAREVGDRVAHVPAGRGGRRGRARVVEPAHHRVERGALVLQVADDRAVRVLRRAAHTIRDWRSPQYRSRMRRL